MPEQPDFAVFYAAQFGALSAQMYAFTGDHAEAQDLARWYRDLLPAPADGSNVRIRPRRPSGQPMSPPST